MPAHNNVNYRPDIDGLRAVAVLSVVIFHIWHDALPGGFIGVDIFFVISGYLISLQLYREIGRGSFSLTDFYLRRIKRIVPVMLLVCAVTVVLAQFIMTPSDSKDTAWSAVWAIFSSANIYFWLFQDTSYFAQSSDELPLLHLWSLGVEEQFYIIWPLVLLLFFKTLSTRWLIPFGIILIIGSVLLAEFTFSTSPMFSYYMLFTRGGELLVGGVVAAIALNYPTFILSGRAVFAVSVAACIGLLYSIIFISKNDTFPGLIVLVPTISAALLIWVGGMRKTFIQKCLSLKCVVFVGLISYSLYLWHWPVLAVYRYGNFAITPLSGIILLVVILAISWLSYRFFEVPFRYSTDGFRSVFFRLYALPSTLLVVFCLLVVKTYGYGIRYLDKSFVNHVNSYEASVRPAYSYSYVCLSFKLNKVNFEPGNCIAGNVDKGILESFSEPKVLLWGDSNAAHYVGALGSIADEAGFTFKNISISACPPLLTNVGRYSKANKVTGCVPSIEMLKPELLKYEHIIISAAWTNYTNASEQFWDDFIRTLDVLRKTTKSIILIGKVPVINEFNRYCELRKLSFPIINCELKPTYIQQSILEANKFLAQVAERFDDVSYFDFNQQLCDLKGCRGTDEGGLPLYYDSTHLSLPGSRVIGEKLIREKGIPKEFQHLSLN
jgi:peptidoglycan/LPS O-acetylase OafA/YrhL